MVGLSVSFNAAQVCVEREDSMMGEDRDIPNEGRRGAIMSSVDPADEWCNGANVSR